MGATCSSSHENRRDTAKQVPVKKSTAPGKKYVVLAKKPVKQFNKKSYEPSADTCISLQEFWLSHTRMLRDLKMFDKIFRTSPELKKVCLRDTNEIVQNCCNQGRQKNCGHQLACFVFCRNHTERAFATLAFLLMLKYESKDGIYALVERMVVRVNRCASAQKQAYNQVVQKGAHAARKPSLKTTRATQWDHLLKQANIAYMETTASTFPQSPAMKVCSSRTDREALNRVYEAIEEYLDDHKEKAFKSALFEPCRFYFDLVGNTLDRDHVDTHGLNWFLVMIRGGIGARLPLIPMDNETDTIGFCDCWSGLHESEVWPYFADPKNFGKSFEGIKALRRETLSRHRFLRDRSIGGCGDHCTRSAARRFAGHSNQVVERRCRQGDEAFKSYVNNFSYFFRREFLVRRMFEVLNSENIPEHVGFRQACNTLYAVYTRLTEWAVEDSLLEHLYGHELTHLDVDRTTAFFAWLGVCKPLRAGWAPEPRSGMAESKIHDGDDSKDSTEMPPEITMGKIPLRTLKDVNDDLQRAMATRDIPSIRLLMQERANMESR